MTQILAVALFTACCLSQWYRGRVLARDRALGGSENLACARNLVFRHESSVQRIGGDEFPIFGTPHGRVCTDSHKGEVIVYRVNGLSDRDALSVLARYPAGTKDRDAVLLWADRDAHR